MIQGYCNKENATIQKEDLNKASWLHLSNPSREEIEKITAQYAIPTNYVTNVLDSDEIARGEHLEDDDEEYPKLVTLLYPMKSSNAQGFTVYNTRAFSIVLTKNLIISASESRPSFFTQLVENKDEYKVALENQESFILEVVWLISYIYIQYLKEIHEEINELEEAVAHSMKTKHLYHLLNLKKSLVFLDSGLESNHPVLEKIKNSTQFSQKDEDSLLLHNMHIENKQAETMIKQYHRLLEQIGDLFSSIISTRLNNLMKVLTSMSIILTIPAIIGALWGMNVRLPFEKTPFAFWILVSGSAAISLMVALLLKKKDFL